MIMKKTIKVEGDYDGTSSKRYYLSVDWDKEKPCAVVIMLSAGKTNGVSFDRSTNYCLENLVRLGYLSMTYSKRHRGNIWTNTRTMAFVRFDTIC